jgi:hypothetical protein
MPKNNGLLACATEIGFIGADLGYFIGEDTTFARNPKVNEPLTSASRWLFHMAPRASGVDLLDQSWRRGKRTSTYGAAAKLVMRILTCLFIYLTRTQEVE